MTCSHCGLLRFAKEHFQQFETGKQRIQIDATFSVPIKQYELPQYGGSVPAL